MSFASADMQATWNVEIRKQNTLRLADCFDDDPLLLHYNVWACIHDDEIHGLPMLAKNLDKPNGYSKRLQRSQKSHFFYVRCTFRYFSLRFVSRKPITASV